MKVHLVPRTGRLVLMPETHQPMPPEGRTVEFNAHWQRRVLDGDVDVREQTGTETATEMPEAQAPRPIRKG